VRDSIATLDARAVNQAIEPQLHGAELDELDAAFGTVRRRGADALVVLMDAIFTARGGKISGLAAGIVCQR
jgi:hypothetical protein